MPKALVIGAGSMGLFLQYLIQESEDSLLLARDGSNRELSEKSLKLTGAIEGELEVASVTWSGAYKNQRHA